MFRRAALQQVAALPRLTQRTSTPLRRLTTFRPTPASRIATFPSTFRTYTTEQPKTTTPITPDPNPPPSPVEAELTDCKAALEAKNQEVIDLKDKYLRSVADFRNLQTITAREVTSAKAFAIQKFASDLIESVDHIDLALSAVPETSHGSEAEEKKDLVELYKGLRMMEKVLLGTLKKHGLEKVKPEVGEKFDPNRHEAVFRMRVEGKEGGSVAVVQRTGFVLNGRVVRVSGFPGGVGVGRKRERGV